MRAWSSSRIFIQTIPPSPKLISFSSRLTRQIQRKSSPDLNEVPKRIRILDPNLRFIRNHDSRHPDQISQQFDRTVEGCFVRSRERESIESDFEHSQSGRPYIGINPTITGVSYRTERMKRRRAHTSIVHLEFVRVTGRTWYRRMYPPSC